MNRLPKRFEDVVLNKHDGRIWWDETAYNKGSTPVSPYEIAAIGIESLAKNNSITIGNHEELHSNNNTYSLVHDKQEIMQLYSSKDFCACIFRAINEAYK